MATCWLVDRRPSKRGQTAPATSTEASVDQGYEGPTPQPDTPARSSAEHSAHAVGHALSVTHRLSCFTRLELNAAPRKATRIKASVDDLPHRSTARRGYLTLASSRPSQLARFLSRLQPDQPVERAYKHIPAHDYNFTGWMSVVNFWSWLVGLSTCGEVPEEKLLHFFWHWSAGSGRA